MPSEAQEETSRLSKPYFVECSVLDCTVLYILRCLCDCDLYF